MGKNKNPTSFFEPMGFEGFGGGLVWGFDSTVFAFTSL
jgi:hypothetical protein